MNGVRRFFAATNVVAPSPSPPPPPKDPTPEPTTELPSLPPLSIGGGKQLYPPAKSSESSPDQITSPTILGSAPTGFSGRNDGPISPRRKAARPDLNGVPNSPSSQIRPSFESSRNSPRASSPPVGSYSRPLMNGTSRAFDALKSTLSLADVTWKPPPSLVNTRDDLLISLLASEAVVDSSGCEILPAEEVEDLKREQRLLSSRLEAMKKKLSLETKIRDAALNLQQLQTVKRLSKQTPEQLDAANRKVEAATKELTRLLERASDIDRRLLEHRSGVLSLAVRNLETKMATLNGEPSEDVGSRSVSVAASRGLNSPASSVTSSSDRAKFDGAHLFAGHADAVVPGSLRRKIAGSAQISALDIKLKEVEYAASAQISALDIKLKEAENVAQAAQNKYVELQKRMQQLENVKGETERSLDFDLQTAQETIAKMEKEMTDMEQAMAQQVAHQDGLEQARQEWERTRAEWDKERQELRKESDLRAEIIMQLEARVRELEEQATKGNDLSDMLRAKDEEIVRLLNNSQDERQRWETQKILFQQEKQEALERFRNESDGLDFAAKEQLDAGLRTVYELIRNHRVVASPTDNSLPGLISAINAHVDSISTKLKLQERDNYELDSARKKYEEDVRNGWEIRERLGKEVEEARKEREEARKELRALETNMKEQELRQSQTFRNIASSDIKYSDDNKIINVIRPVWSALPSVEARALRAGKSSSVAELDVRSLKSLYDPKAGFNSPTVSGEFSIDDFVARVQALIVDDRALIERLIRFAQSHDLLRNNAERAQKLAQDSNKGLETYQTQVKTLEERNVNLTRKQLTMLDEINELQQSVDIVSQEKRDMEAQLKELQDKICTLSDLKTQPANVDGETAALEADKAKLEGQLVELQKKLEGTESELERVATSEFSQRAVLLDELNSLQQENSQLRDQLRAKK